MLKHHLTHAQQSEVMAFVQNPQPGSYQPASGQIFGILSQMKETFESNLSTSQKEEATNQEMYEGVKTTKEAEITAGQKQIDAKTIELADTDEKNAQAKEDLKDTENTLSADEKFLATVKEQCSLMEAEFNQRNTDRATEMEACSKAMAILSGDDAHDLFKKTLGFVQ